MDKKNDIEFDLIELVLYLKKRLWIIALSVIVLFVGGYVGSKIMITPTYTATAQMYVVYDVSNDVPGKELDEAYTQQLMAGQLRNDCVVLLGSRNVTAEVINNLGLKMSATGLSSRVMIEPQDNTRILNLSFTDTNPELAAQILNEICNVGKSQIQEMVGEDAVRLVYGAEVPTSPSSPSPSRNAIVAAILGLVASVSILVIVFLLDDSIRSEVDMEHYLGLSTLAEIPVSDELNHMRQSTEGKSARGRLSGFRK